MTSGNAAAEAITSDPVIIEVSDAAKPTSVVSQYGRVEEETPEIKETLEDGIRNIDIAEPCERIERHQPARVSYPRTYSRSRSPLYRVEAAHRRPSAECIVLANTASLNSILDEGDACVETLKGRLVYVTSHDFHAADLQKLSWLFQFGVSESWIQKPTTFLPGNAMQFDLPNRGRGRHDFYDDDYDRFDNGSRGGPIPMAQLGSALRTFKDDADPLTSKVKFVTVVGVKNDSSWVKMTVSHSRQAAASQIFHEILNNHSVIFVGAVLRNVAIPAENPNKKARKLQRVASVQEAEELEPGVIGIIC